MSTDQGNGSGANAHTLVGGGEALNKQVTRR
jgi:hypothetical protein